MLGGAGVGDGAAPAQPAIKVRTTRRIGEKHLFIFSLLFGFRLECTSYLTTSRRRTASISGSRWIHPFCELIHLSHRRLNVSIFTPSTVLMA